MTWNLKVTNPPAPKIIVRNDGSVQIKVSNAVTRVVKVVSQGPQGIPGVQGPPGATTGDLHHVHTQSVPAAAWTVTHSLGKMPSVTVVDSANEIVYGDVDYLSDDAVALTFAGAFSGQAFCN